VHAHSTTRLAHEHADGGITKLELLSKELAPRSNLNGREKAWPMPRKPRSRQAHHRYASRQKARSERRTLSEVSPVPHAPRRRLWPPAPGGNGGHPGGGSGGGPSERGGDGARYGDDNGDGGRGGTDGNDPLAIDMLGQDSDDTDGGGGHRADHDDTGARHRRGTGMRETGSDAHGGGGGGGPMRHLGHGGSEDNDDGDLMVLDGDDCTAPDNDTGQQASDGSGSRGHVGAAHDRGSHDAATFGEEAGRRRDSGDRDATGLGDEVGARDSGGRAATGLGREAGHGVSVHPLQGTGPLAVDMLARGIADTDSGGRRGGDHDDTGRRARDSGGASGHVQDSGSTSGAHNADDMDIQATGSADLDDGCDGRNVPGLGDTVDHGASVRNLTGFGMREPGRAAGGVPGGDDRGGGGGNDTGVHPTWRARKNAIRKQRRARPAPPGMPDGDGRGGGGGDLVALGSTTDGGYDDGANAGGPGVCVGGDGGRGGGGGSHGGDPLDNDMPVRDGNATGGGDGSGGVDTDTGVHPTWRARKNATRKQRRDRPAPPG